MPHGHETANKIAPLFQAQAEDPERFGQSVMEAQSAYVKAKQDLQVAQKILNETEAKEEPTDKVNLAKENLEKSTGSV